MELERLGPYRLERILGSGGMGIVYAGVEEKSGREVAIKVLSRTLVRNEAFRDRFNAEIETLKKLHHPHIVELYGYGEQHGQLYYSMELVEGRSLQDELQRGKAFDWHDVTRIAIQVCQALKHAHDHGVIHRDLKPANLMWSRDKLIKLSDFGIAKLFGSTHVTMAGSVIGTADYMSPEQADGKPVTHRSDLYSLGSVMYALLARRPPLAAASVPDVLHALKYDEPPPLKRLAPDTPAALQEIIHQLLQKDPERRVANAYVLSNQLKAMEFGLSAPTRVEAAVPPDAIEPEAASSDAPPREAARAVSQGASGSTVEHAWQPPRPRSQDARTGRETRLEPDSSHDEPSVEEEEPSDRFTTVEEEHRRRDQRWPSPPPEDAGSWLKLAVGVVAAIVIALAGWWASRPATADELFARVETAANDAQALIDAESDIGLFLERFPDDPRREQVRQWQADAELERFSRRMDRELRRPSGPGHLTPAELALLDALRHEHSDPELAAKQLAALIDVFSSLSDDDATVTAQCVKMAQRKLQTLRQVIRDDQQQKRQLIDERIRWARQTMSRDPRAARQVLEGLITLYGDDPSAASEIELARKLLSEMAP